MAMTLQEQVDFLWKRLQFGVTKTAASTDKTGSNETIASPLPVTPSSIWREADLIPAAAPATTTAQVKVFTGAARIKMTTDPTSTPNMTWLATTTFGSAASRIGNFVPPTFGVSYAAKIWLGDPAGSKAARIFPDTSGEEWVFDYSAGVLIFTGTIPANKTATIGSGTVSAATDGVFLEVYQYVGPTGAGSSVDPSDLGSMSSQDKEAVDITGGTISGVTFTNVTIDGGTF